MNVTTIKLYGETKQQLNLFREYKNESYDEIIKKLVYIARLAGKNPKLTSQTVQEIERARQRLKNGEFYTEEQVSKMLGLK